MIQQYYCREEFDVGHSKVKGETEKYSKSDKHLIFPQSIMPKSNIMVMRIKEMITNSRCSWLLHKFSL